MLPVQRVLLVDDHAVVRSGLALILAHTDGFSICGEASNAEQARQLAENLQPDIVVLDLLLGGIDGLPLVAAIRDLCPRTRILIFSMQDEMIYARRALLAGAQGYLTKSADSATVLQALRAMAAGRHYVSPAVAEQVLVASISSGSARNPLDRLSDRELDVLRLTSEGKSLGEIAGTLGVSVKTIGTHRERLKNKLGARNVRELAREAGVLLQPGTSAWSSPAPQPGGRSSTGQ